MMHIPQISVVMACYNSECHLADCIKSVLQQSFCEFEFIIVDDGSTDQTVSIIEDYQKKDRRIYLIRNEHNYISSLNIGIQRARSKYIVRMDSDDLMLESRLEKQYDFMESNSNIDICGSWAIALDNEGERVMSTITEHDDILKNLLFGNVMYHPTIIMRKSSLTDVFSDLFIYEHEYIYAEDYKLWVTSAIAGLKFSNLSEPLIKYRLSANQNTVKYNKQMQTASLQVQNFYIEYLCQQIVEKRPDMLGFMEASIELCNNDEMSFYTMKHIVSDIYTSLEVVNTSSKIGQNL